MTPEDIAGYRRAIDDSVANPELWREVSKNAMRLSLVEKVPSIDVTQLELQTILAYGLSTSEELQQRFQSLHLRALQLCMGLLEAPPSPIFEEVYVEGQDDEEEPGPHDIADRVRYINHPTLGNLTISYIYHGEHGIDSAYYLDLVTDQEESDPDLLAEVRTFPRRGGVIDEVAEMLDSIETLEAVYDSSGLPLPTEDSSSEGNYQI